MTLLKVDMDRKSLWALYEVAQRAGFIAAVCDGFSCGFGVAETKKGYHIYINVDERLSDKDVLCLQAILCDDWKRAVFNFRCVRNGVKKWNVLFNSTEKERCVKMALFMTAAYMAYRTLYRIWRSKP